jgi:hypothetical protein
MSSRSTVIVVLVVLLGAASTWADNGVPGPAELQAAYERAMARQERVSAVERDRAAFVRQMLDPWRGQIPDGGTEMEEILRETPVERVLAASEAKTLEAFRRAVLGVTNVIGDSAADLSFFPLTPCRLFDTRLAAAGILVAGAPRTFAVNGSLTSQGGDAAGCGVPVDPAAVAVTLAAVTPTGAGNIRAWAYLDPVPTASAINFSTALPAIANTTIIPVCPACGAGLDIQLRADASNVHAVGDVVGYFQSPTGLPVARRTRFTFIAVTGTTAVDLTSLMFTPSRSGSALVTATGYCNVSGTANLEGLSVGVMGGGGVTGSIFMRVPAGAPDESHQLSFAVQDFVATTAGTPATVTLQATAYSPNGGDKDCSGNMVVRETFSAVQY